MNEIVLLALVDRPLLSSTLRAEQNYQWTFEFSLYGLAAGISRDLAIGLVDAPVDFVLDKVWDNLGFAMIGNLRRATRLKQRLGVVPQLLLREPLDIHSDCQ